MLAQIGLPPVSTTQFKETDNDALRSIPDPPESGRTDRVEQHGRQLIQKGYAELDSSDGDVAVSLTEEDAAGSGVLTSNALVAPTDSGRAKKLGLTAKKGD